MKKLTSVDYLVVHCSATQAKADIGRAEIDKWHRQRKMLEIGYHYVIRRDGTLEIGRENDVMGAHVRGYNHNSIGICMIGGVDKDLKPEQNFETPQYTTLRSLLGYLKSNHPHAVIQGHRDFPGVAKACPSFDVMAWFDGAQ